jgi:hypothetical protein
VQLCIDGTGGVTYCHSCTRIYSHAGIICAVDTRRKRSFDRSVTMLEFMAALYREGEDSHATLFALLYCLYGQMQIVVVWQQKCWSVFGRLDMCYVMFCISYRCSSVVYPDGWTVCYICSMYPVFSDSVGEVLFTSACCTLLQCIAKI